jgi:O-antigen/teichoic acid export membrane protein
VKDSPAGADSNASMTSHLLRGTAWITLAEALLLPTGFVTLTFLTRQLGADGYGLFALGATLITWIEWGINSVFSRTVVKAVSEASEQSGIATAVLRAQLGVGLVAALIVILIAPLIAALLNEPALTNLLRLFALEIPLVNLAQAHQNILTGLGKFNARAMAIAVRWIARLIFIVCLVKMGLSIPGAILGSIAAMLADLVVCRFYIRPSLWRFSNFPIQTLAGYAVPLFMAALAVRLYAKLDLIALKALGGTAEQVGIYAVAQNLALFGGLMGSALAPVLIATLSRLVSKGEFDRVRTLSREAMRVVILHLPFAALLVGSAGEILLWLFDELFVAAAPIFSLLIFATVGTVMIGVTSAILVASDKPHWTAILSVPMPVVALIGHWLLIPHFGAIGASATTLLVSIVGVLAGIGAVYKQWSVLPPVITLGRSCLVSIVIFFIAQYWTMTGVGLLIKLPILGVITIVILLSLGEISTKDRKILISLFQGNQ